MRRRIHLKGLVSRTEPDGHCSFLAKSFELRKKFKNGTITEEELEELVSSGDHQDLIVSGSIQLDTPTVDDKFKTIIIFGKEMRVSIEEHSVHHTLICM